MNQPHPPSAPAAPVEPQAIEYAPLAGRVDVWRCELGAGAAVAASLAQWLAPEEHARAARFGTCELRERYITGRGALRAILSRYLATDPAQVPIVRGPRGRPHLRGEGPDFNVTHTDKMAVFAIGYGLSRTQRLGVDIEHAERTLNVERLAKKLLTEDERSSLAALEPDAARIEFLETWTCKEAMSKATGDGLRAPFGRIAVQPHGAPCVLAGPKPYTPDAWQLHRVPVMSCYLVTVALWQM